MAVEAAAVEAPLVTPSRNFLPAAGRVRGRRAADWAPDGDRRQGCEGSRIGRRRLPTGNQQRKAWRTVCVPFARPHPWGAANDVAAGVSRGRSREGRSTIFGAHGARPDRMTQGSYTDRDTRGGREILTRVVQDTPSEGLFLPPRVQCQRKDVIVSRNHAGTVSFEFDL